MGALIWESQKNNFPEDCVEWCSECGERGVNRQFCYV